MPDQMRALRDTTVRALFSQPETAFPPDLDLHEVEAIAREKVKRYVSAPFLVSAETDRTFDPFVFKKVEKRILKLLRAEKPGAVLSVVLSLFQVPDRYDIKHAKPDKTCVFRSRNLVIFRSDGIYEIIFNHKVTIRGTLFDEGPDCPEYADYAVEKVYRDLTALGLSISIDAHRLDITRPAKVPRWHETDVPKFSERFPAEPLPQKTSENQLISIANAVAAEAWMLARHCSPVISFYLSFWTFEQAEQIGKRKMCEDFGIEIADNARLKACFPKDRFHLLTHTMRDTEYAMYVVFVFTSGELLADGFDERFAKALEEKLGEMGYAAKLTFDIDRAGNHFLFHIAWIDEEDWTRYWIASADPSAVAAIEAGVPIEDVIV